MENQEKSNSQPEKKFRAGAISATIWANSGKKDEKSYEFKTISLERSYKDKEDQWQNTKSFRVADLPKVQLVLDKAYEYLVLSAQDANDIKSNVEPQLGVEEEMVM